MAGFGALCPQIFPGSGAYEFVSAEYQTYAERVRNLSNEAAVAIDALESFTPDFSGIEFEVSTDAFDNISLPELGIDGVDEPEYVAPVPKFADSAPAPISQASFDDGSGIRGVGSAPRPDFGDLNLQFPSAPSVNLPQRPGDAPIIDPGEVPDEIALSPVDLPNLAPLDEIPPAPEYEIPRFEEDPPEWEAPSSELQDLYFTEVGQRIDVAQVGMKDFDEVSEDHLGNLQRMYDFESIGLPKFAEDIIINRQSVRNNEALRRTIDQAMVQWTARGFDLPGAAVASTVREAVANVERENAQVRQDREVQFVQEVIQNYRFMIEQGIRRELEMRRVYLEIEDNARQHANAHFAIQRAIYETFIAVEELEIRIYTSKIQIFEANVRIALGQIEAYRAVIEAERVKSDINTQLVNQYEAQIRAELAKVEVYRGQIEAYNGKVRAEVAKIEGFKAKVDAYEAETRAQIAEVDIYSSEVQAEGTKAEAYRSVIGAYTARVEGYRAQVEAEATKTRSINDVVESESRVYQSQVEAWSQGVNTDVRRVEAAVSEFRGKIDAYTAQLGALEADERLKALGFDKELERARATIAAELQNIDKAIAVLNSSSQLELQKLTDAGRINAQLAASSMASLSLSASLSGSDSFSAGSSSSCSTNYSGLVG